MKLHLPKSLRSALLATFAVVAFSSSAYAGWSPGDSKQEQGSITYYLEPNNSGSSINKQDAINAAPNDPQLPYTKVVISAGRVGAGTQDATLSSVTIAAADTLAVSRNPWVADANGNSTIRDFDKLVINNVVVGDGTGVAALEIGSNQVVQVDAVSGELSSVTNAGTLALGNAVINGNIENNGNLSVTGEVTLRSVQLNGNLENIGTLKTVGTIAGTGVISGDGNIKVDISKELSAYSGMKYTYADGSAAASSGFIRGEQTFRVFGEDVSYEGNGNVYVNDTEAAVTVAEGGYITADVGSSNVFYVNDTWNYNADQSSGATSFDVSEIGTLNFAGGSTASGGLVINSEGAVTMSAETTMTGEVTINGGTFDNRSHKIEGGTLVLNGLSSATISGDRKLSLNLELVNTYLRIGTGDTFDYDDTGKLTYKIGSGATLDVQSNRQSVRSNHIIEMAGGTLTGAGASNGNYVYGIDFYNGGRFNTSANSLIATNVGGHINGNVQFDVNTGKTLTMTGNLVGVGTFSKTAGGTMVYKGAAFTQALTIGGGVFEYYVNTDAENKVETRNHNGTISGSATLRKSGVGVLNLSSTNVSVTKFDVTGGTLGYDLVSGEKSITLTGSGGTFAKKGVGTVNLGALTSYNYNGTLKVTEGKVVFTGSADEQAAAPPAFVKLVNNLTTEGDGLVEIVGDVEFNYNGDDTPAENCVITMDDNLHITGNLEINSWGSGNAPDGDGMRRWNVNRGGNIAVDGHLWLTNQQKMVINGGHVSALNGVRLGHSQNSTQGIYKSKFVLEDGSLSTSSFTFYAGGSEIIMSGGELIFTPAADGDSVLKNSYGGNNPGINKLTITGGTLKATDSSWALTGSSTNVVSLGNVTFDIASGKTVTLSGNIALTGSVESYGKGELQLGNTTFSIAEQDLNSFTVCRGEVADSSQENGLGGRVYSVLWGTGSIAQLDGTNLSVLIGGAAAGDRWNADAFEITSSATNDFIINTQFATSDATAANGAVGADSFIVNKGGTFTVAGDITDGKTAKELVMETLGSGTMSLTTDVSLSHSGDATKFHGNLDVESDVTLTLGRVYDTGLDSTSSNTVEYDVDVSSLAALNLNGGTLKMYYVAPHIKSMSVNKVSSIVIDDTWKDCLFNKLDATRIDNLTLNDVLNLTTGWKSNVNIGAVAGSGDLIASQNNPESNYSQLWIDSVAGYTGNISIKGKMNLTLNVGENETFKSSQLTINGGDASAVLTGSGTYVLEGTSTLKVSGVTDLDNWTGTVKITNTHIGAFNPASYGNANSAVELCGVTTWMAENSQMASLLKLTKDGDKNGLTITDGSNWTHTFSGKVTGEGDFTISGTGNGSPTFVFTGDLSEWKGAFREENASAGKTVNLNLTGGGTLFADAAAGVYMNQSVDGKFAVIVGHDSKDTTMRGTVSNAGSAGELNLTVQGNTTFEADVTATQVTVNSGKTAKLGSVATISGQGGNAVLTEVHMNNTGISGTAASSSVKDALLALKSGASFTVKDVDLSNVTLSAETKDTLVQLQNVTGAATLQTGTYAMDAVQVPAATRAATTTINYQLAGSVELTLANNETSVIISTDPWADCGVEPNVYDMSFSMNLTLGADFTVESLTGEDWRELVSFGGGLGELLDLQGATYLSPADEVASITGNPYVFYDYEVTDGIGSLVVTVHGVTVPEPTTATLSLLALAALAARRRRK